MHHFDLASLPRPGPGWSLVFNERVSSYCTRCFSCMTTKAIICFSYAHRNKCCLVSIIRWLHNNQWLSQWILPRASCAQLRYWDDWKLCSAKWLVMAVYNKEEFPSRVLPIFLSLPIKVLPARRAPKLVGNLSCLVRAAEKVCQQTSSKAKKILWGKLIFLSPFAYWACLAFWSRKPGEIYWDIAIIWWSSIYVQKEPGLAIVLLLATWSIFDKLQCVRREESYHSPIYALSNG